MATPEENLITNVTSLVIDLGITITPTIDLQLHDWVDVQLTELANTVPALELVTRVRKGARLARLSGMSITVGNIKHVIVRYDDTGATVFEDAADLTRE